MEPINYDEARIEGGIEAFRDVIDEIPVEATLGEIALKPGTAELPPGIIDEEDEDVLTQAA